MLVAETSHLTANVGAWTFPFAVSYLRIYLDPRIHDDTAIAILGHELQHAWEIAHARWVVNQTTLVELYEQIGYRSDSGPGWYGVDTRRAQQAAREARRELQAFRGRLGATD